MRFVRNVGWNLISRVVDSKYIFGVYGEDAGWVMPLPDDEHRLNENMVENEKRPEREDELSKKN